MGLEEILKKINAQGEAEAHQIIEESKKRAEKIKEKAEQQASEEAKDYSAEEKHRAEMEATRIMTQARLEKRMKILFCKKKIIDDILEEAFNQALKGRESLKKTVITKDGQEQGTLDKEKLKEELRSLLEGQIAEELKL